MVIIPKIAFRGSRRKPVVTHAPPAPLTIVSASFDSAVPSASITFDREIDISAIVPTAFVINDDLITGNQYTCMEFGASHDGPETVVLNLQVIGSAEGGQVRLNASAANGIVASDDGGTFAGVVNLV